MKKTVWLTSILFLTGIFSLTAGNLDFQLGGGYSGYFTGAQTPHPDFAAGFSFYGGGGYRFFPTLSAGLEYEYARAWAFDEELDGYSVVLSHHIPKAYIKMNALNILTVTGLAGVDIQNILVDTNSVDTRNTLTAGVRISAMFAYFQYFMCFDQGVDHRFGAGFVFNR